MLTVTEDLQINHCYIPLVGIPDGAVCGEIFGLVRWEQLHRQKRFCH